VSGLADMPDGATFEEVKDVGAAGSTFYLFTASELYDPNPMLTPIFYVYADKGFDSKEDAYHYIEAAGIVALAQREKGAVLVMNPIGTTWTAQDLAIHKATYEYISFMGSNAKLTYHQMNYLIGEAHGTTFINQLISRNAHRIAGALLVHGGVPILDLETMPMPVYIVSTSTAPIEYYTTLNNATEEKTISANVVEYYNPANPVERVVSNIAADGALTPGVVNEAWQTVFRRTVRQCVEEPQMFDPDWDASTEVFTLMDRPVPEEVGLKVINADYTWVAGNGGSGTGWFEWVPEEATVAGTKAKFPLVISLHGSNDHPVYEAESNGWVKIAGDERLIVASPANTSADAVHAMIDTLAAKYPIDESRIYVTGFSAGARAALNAAAFENAAVGRYARFAGMAPMGMAGNFAFIDADVQLPFIGVLGGNDQYGSDNGFYQYPQTILNALAFNGMTEPAGTDDPFWGVVTANPETVNTRYGRVITTATYLDDEDVPFVKLARGENMDHAHFVSYGEVAWDYLEHFSRNLDSKEVVYDPDPENVAYTMNVDVFEWGSAVTAVIIDTESTVYAADIDEDTFTVDAVTKNPLTEEVVYDGSREILSAYVAATNEKGAAPVDSGRYVVLELKSGYNATSEEVDGSAAVIYTSGRNYWLDLDYTITQEDDVEGLSGNICYKKTVRPDFDQFELIENTAEGYGNQLYRMYTPEETNAAVPLVIFNHGAGETYQESNGKNNEGAQLFANFGGIGWVKNMPEQAYVLVPQRNFANYSRAGVVAFIQALIAQGKVDANRIYVSGASAGGSETHNFLMEYPDFFAGAIAVATGGLNEAQLKSIRHIPIWYVHGSGDGNNRQTVDPAGSLNNYNTLKAMGADVRRTLFPAQNVLNPDYTPGATGLNGYEYYLRSIFGEAIPTEDYAYDRYPDPHWSWVPVLNNVEIKDGYYDSTGSNDAAGYGYTTEGTEGMRFMDWLFSQTREDDALMRDISDDNDDENDNDLGVSFDNDRTDAEDLTLIIAQYDADGKLLCVETKDITEEGITTFYIDKVEGCASAKAFAWDGDDIPFEAALVF
jgi:predicted peptidase